MASQVDEVAAWLRHAFKFHFQQKLFGFRQVGSQQAKHLVKIGRVQ
jgi:hypothetical protein